MDQLNFNNSIKTERETILSIIILAILVLLISHGTINTLFPNILINLMALILISVILYILLIVNKLYFSFVMIMYICSHFPYASTYGGTFVIISFLVISPQFFKDIFSELKISDYLITTLIIVLIINTVLGWIFKNNMPIMQFAAGVFSFFGYIVIFLFSARIFIDTNKIKILVNIIIFMAFFIFIFSFNNYFEIITIASPIIYSPFGAFANSELLGEYSMVIFLILFPFLFSNHPQLIANISKRRIIVGLITSLLSVFISISRSALILISVGAMAELLFIWFFSDHTIFNKKSRLFANSVIIFSIMVIFWKPLNLNYILERFTNPDLASPIHISTNINLLTGEGTPRELAFSYFLIRFPQESWWIGYGWGVPVSNRIAWFSNPEVLRAGYHSLYLSLLMIYGWIGSVSFISLILITIVRLKNIFLKNYRNSIHYLLQVGFFFALLFMMINEYKISLLRNETYQLIVWIWLGIANALIYSSSYIDQNRHRN